MGWYHWFWYLIKIVKSLSKSRAVKSINLSRIFTWIVVADAKLQESMTSDVIKGHIRCKCFIKGHIKVRSLVCKIVLEHSFMVQFWWKIVWMLISWRHNIWPKMSLLCYGEVLWFFTLRPSHLITTLTYVLMDNFCPCLSID